MLFTFPLLLTIYAGFTHAFEADHLLAVSNIVSRRNRIWLSMKDGAFWGLGHSSTIFLIGILMILFKVGISEHSFHYFEAAVGAMLIILAIYRLIQFGRGKNILLHQHQHAHNYAPRAYQKSPVYLATQYTLKPLPYYAQPIHTHHHTHKLAYGVGLVHGLAGSGALVVLVMAQIKSPVHGLFYLLVFSVGCIGGMLVAAGLFSVPFSKKLIQAPTLQSLLIVATSILCLVYGGKVIYDNLMLL